METLEASVIEGDAILLERTRPGALNLRHVRDKRTLSSTESPLHWSTGDWAEWLDRGTDPIEIHLPDSVMYAEAPVGAARTTVGVILALVRCLESIRLADGTVRTDLPTNQFHPWAESPDGDGENEAVRYLTSCLLGLYTTYGVEITTVEET